MYYNGCIYAKHRLYSLSCTANLQKLQTSEDTVITVDAKAAGKGKVTCKVQTPQGMELDMDVVENHDGTFDIYYTAPEPGKYVITIRFGGQNIPKSPFHVVVSQRAFVLTVGLTVTVFLSFSCTTLTISSFFPCLSLCLDRPQMSPSFPAIPSIPSSVPLTSSSPSRHSKGKSQV